MWNVCLFWYTHCVCVFWLGLHNMLANINAMQGEVKSILQERSHNIFLSCSSFSFSDKHLYFANSAQNKSVWNMENWEMLSFSYNLFEFCSILALFLSCYIIIYWYANYLPHLDTVLRNISHPFQISGGLSQYYAALACLHPFLSLFICEWQTQSTIANNGKTLYFKPG